VPHFLLVPSRDAPPFGLGRPPARGLLGRLRDRLLSPVLLGLYNRQAPELDAVRTELGAPPVGRIERAMLRAPLMLYMTAEPFEYPRSDWPPSLRMVGPGFWDPLAKPPDWLEEISRPAGPRHLLHGVPEWREASPGGSATPSWVDRQGSSRGRKNDFAGPDAEGRVPGAPT
jgi:hypothetical protein